MMISMVGAVMTLPTGVQAVAEGNYGNMDKALDYLHTLHNSFSYATPGTMYEVSPDYGMLVQAWNIYSVAKPIVSHFFGVKPKAYEKRIHLKPHLPSSWKSGKIQELKIGDNEIDFSIDHVQDRIVYAINQEQKDWGIQLSLPESVGKKVYLNGDEIKPEKDGDQWQIELTGRSNEVVVE